MFSAVVHALDLLLEFEDPVSSVLGQWFRRELLEVFEEVGSTWGLGCRQG